jgi:hypothetical protein
VIRLRNLRAPAIYRNSPPPFTQSSSAFPQDLRREAHLSLRFLTNALNGKPAPPGAAHAESNRCHSPVSRKRQSRATRGCLFRLIEAGGSGVPKGFTVTQAREGQIDCTSTRS